MRAVTTACYLSVMTTTTANPVPQPFMRQAPAHECTPACTQGTQIVPVAGNNDRAVSVFVAYHGHDHLTIDGLVTRTPVHMTYADAAAAEARHALRSTDTAELLTKAFSLTYKMNHIERTGRGDAADARAARDLIVAEIIRRTEGK